MLFPGHSGKWSSKIWKSWQCRPLQDSNYTISIHWYRYLDDKKATINLVTLLHKFVFTPHSQSLYNKSVAPKESSPPPQVGNCIRVIRSGKASKAFLRHAYVHATSLCKTRNQPSKLQNEVSKITHRGYSTQMSLSEMDMFILPRFFTKNHYIAKIC